MIYRDITLLSATIAKLYIPGTLNIDPRIYKKDKRKELLYYSKALRCTFFGELKSTCSSKTCIIRSVVCNTVFKNKKSVLLKVSTL